jgi:hypothetical protein
MTETQASETSIGDSVVNLKAGWSSYCQREQHRSCATARARCSCPCHGTSGQEPPTPKGDTNVSTRVDLPRPSANGIKPYPCPEPGCLATFATPQGLGPHRAKTHGYRNPPKAKPRKPKLSTKSVRASLDDYDPWVVIVGLVDDDGIHAETVVLAGDHECQQVAHMLERLGHKCHVFRLADA